MLFFLQIGFVGAFTGVMAGLLGVGGGFIMIPLLNLINFPMHIAIGTSLVYVTFAAGSGALTHARQGTVDAVLALPVIVSALGTIWIGSYFSDILPDSTLQLLFGFLTLLVLVAFIRWGDQDSLEQPLPGNRQPVNPTAPHRFWVIPRSKRFQDRDSAFQVDLIKGLLVGSLVGFVSGLFGIGGGWLLVPLLVLLMGIPLPIAIGTSLVAILVPAAAGALVHWRLGNVDVSASVALVVPGIAGAIFGARMVSYLRPRTLKLLFCGLLLCAALSMLGAGSELF